MHATLCTMHDAPGTHLSKSAHLELLAGFLRGKLGAEGGAVKAALLLVAPEALGPALALGLVP